jgi:hypothetical protein
MAKDKEEVGEANGGDKRDSGGDDDDDLFSLITVLNLGRYRVCCTVRLSVYKLLLSMSEYLLVRWISD